MRSGQNNDQEASTSSESNTPSDKPVSDEKNLATALKGDWQAAKILIEKYRDLVRSPITERNETALHIAVAAKQATFVKELVKHMTSEDIELKNKNGNTALCFAAFAGGSKVVSIAKEMVKKNKKLPSVRGRKEKTPLYFAASNGRRKMVSYLYDVTPFEDLKPIERIDILVATISTDMYDIALTILKKDPSTLATMKNSEEEIALQELARKPLAFDSRSQLSVWERCFNSWFKGTCNKALIQLPAHKLVQLLWREVLVLPEDKFIDLLEEHSSLLFEAAELGNVEYLIILIGSYPDLIWRVDKNVQTIFHIAVRHRQENVFNLIYELGAIKGMVAKYTNSEFNMLHLAGQLAPLDRLNIISGAPLQMQRELLWFKEIEKIVPPLYKKLKNIDRKSKRVDICICECLENTYQKGQVEDKDQDNKAVNTPSNTKTENTDKKCQPRVIDQDGGLAATPWELFKNKHKELKEQGEKWMKDTANYCMLVAALIATVVFAGAFTVPGGNDQEIGTPIFLKSKWFMVFFISDALALLFSSTSMLIFLSILTSRYAEEDFLMSLPTKLLVGFTTLFVSIASMIVAFSATCFLFYYSEVAWVPIILIASASIPVTLFVLLHYQLWVDILRSTYSSKFLFRPHKHKLF
ncbi:ankyrin repeat-containing protein NPR4-like isoform X2 [Corylus avellana]|uniref:ankyrin repeat-containing protein NPR4-like isoform X2 n=1 Tax=Corylus avellana TaxID=13451 RepID=UPI00286BC9F0|nr:ankyrin repeat-containing protein NPR4-like isoform X2 [Corylus avellana]